MGLHWSFLVRLSSGQGSRLVSPIAVIGFAFFLRLAWAALVPIVPISDAHAYHTFAMTLSTTGVYGWSENEPTAFWPVGTAALYAIAYKTFGPGSMAVLIVNLAFGLLVVGLTMRLGTVWFNRQIGLIAGLIVAVWPVFIQYTTIIASELIFAACLLASLLVLARITASKEQPIYLLLTLGVLIGLASLVRPIALLLPLVLAFPVAVESRSVMTTLRFAVVALVGLAVVVGPWAYRNQSHFGELIPVSTSGGTNLWMGNNPATTGFYQDPPAADPRLTEPQRDRKLKDDAIAYIARDPLAFVGRTLVKAVRLYERETIGVAWNQVGLERSGGIAAVSATKALAQAFWIIILGLFVAGCLIEFKRDRFGFLSHPAIVVLAYSTVVYALFVIQDRYHIPTNPLMATFAAIAIARLASRWTGRRWSTSPPSREHRVKGHT